MLSRQLPNFSRNRKDISAGPPQTTRRNSGGALCGSCIAQSIRRFRTRNARFFHSKFAFFTKSAAAPGHRVVSSGTLDGRAQDAAQKFMLDAMWEITLSDLVTQNIPRPPADTVRRINAERTIYPRGDKSFQQLLKEELHGALEALLPHIMNAMRDLASVFGIAADSADLTPQNFRPVINLIRESVIQRLDQAAIPSLRVRSALHAALRLDDQRPFRENDLPDIDHSAVAVSYCDVFFTERSFGDLLRRPFIKDVSMSPCAVASDPEEALAVLRLH